MESIGRYRVDAELGRGAMGVVYRGFDPRMSRPVAIKVIRLDQTASADEKADSNLRFAREAAAAGNLAHANIVAVYDSGEQGDLQYIVLELVDGGSLEKTLPNGVPQDRKVAVSVLAQVAGALDHAHGKGIIHRDVKPANILVCADGSVKITDFGIARITDQTITRTGLTVGTPAYMAPEQIMSGRVNGKADQFSLAVLAYQMLSGRMPFVAAGMPALMHKIVYEEPPALRDLTSFYPPRASEVLKKGLAKDPGQRYATCAEFVRDLAAALEEGKATAPPVRRAAAALAKVAEREQATELLDPPSPPPRTPPGDRVEKPFAGHGGNLSGDRGAPITNRRQVANLPHKIGPYAVGIGAAAVAAVILLWAFGVFGARHPAPAPPTIAQFTADPPSIQRGQASTVRWQVGGNATGVSIDHGVGAVQNSGERSLAPGESTMYTLTAVGPGGTARASATVGVTEPPPPEQPRSKVNSVDGLTYRWIPPGTFTMGCSPRDSECYDEEKPAHPVTINKGFWLGQTPVTQAAYRRVTGLEPSHFQGDNLPVEEVNWNEAQSYCQKIGGRLPTEAEWEYAARAGSTGPRYGNVDEVAWTSSNSGSTTHPVGMKLPNAFGLFDMLGNVSQWTADWYGAYQAGSVRDPTGPASSTYRTFRGGSWYFNPRYARASNRNWELPVSRVYSMGLRCVGE